MHPLLLVTFMLNLLLINGVFGMWGLFGAMVGAFAIYALISKSGRPKLVHWGQIAAIAFGHAAGVFAVSKATWSSPAFVGVAFIMELFIVAIFVGLGRR
jgi:hypothetical protein